MNGIKIKGTGQCLPSHIMTNEDLSRIVETNDAWITTRTGIEHRHHVSGEETISGLTAAAARQLPRLQLTCSGVSRQTIRRSDARRCRQPDSSAVGAEIRLHKFHPSWYCRSSERVPKKALSILCVRPGEVPGT